MARPAEDRLLECVEEIVLLWCVVWAVFPGPCVLMPVCSAAKCSVRDALLLRRRRYYVEIPPYLANSNWEADALSEGQVRLRSTRCIKKHHL